MLTKGVWDGKAYVEETDTVAAGQKARFQVSTKVPSYQSFDRVFTVTDTYAATLGAPQNLVVKAGDANLTDKTDYTYTLDASKRTFTVTLTAVGLQKAVKAQSLTVTYDSVVAANARSTDENVDSAKLTYSTNSNGDATETATTAEDKAWIVLYKLVVKKVDD